MPGYVEEEGVAPSSVTETFVAARVSLDNWRWADTPFYLRTGKRLPKRVTEVAIQFKRVPHLPFSYAAAEQLEPNVLVLHIQPDEGISLRFGAKVPATRTQIRTVNMDFDYGTAFSSPTAEAYETLLLDAMRGDPTNFTRQDAVTESWRVVEPVLEAWQRQARRAAPVRRRHLGAGRRRRPHRARREALAATVSVTLSTIEATLADLRAHETSGSGRGVRTHMLDLVVFCDRREQADEMVEVVASLPHSRPSRAIIALGLDDDSDVVADARVFCTPVSGDSTGVQVCSEIVSLERRPRRHRAAEPGRRAAPARPAGVPALACRARRLAGRARRACGSSRPASSSTRRPCRARSTRSRALVQRQPDRSVTDLSWTKITGWREAVARAFDNAENARCARRPDASRDRATSARATRRRACSPAWLTSRTGRTPEVAIESEDDDDMRDGSLTRVELDVRRRALPRRARRGGHRASSRRPRLPEHTCRCACRRCAGCWRRSSSSSAATASSSRPSRRCERRARHPRPRRRGTRRSRPFCELIWEAAPAHARADRRLDRGRRLPPARLPGGPRPARLGRGRAALRRRAARAAGLARLELPAGRGRRCSPGVRPGASSACAARPPIPRPRPTRYARADPRAPRRHACSAWARTGTAPRSSPASPCSTRRDRLSCRATRTTRRTSATR